MLPAVEAVLRMFRKRGPQVWLPRLLHLSSISVFLVVVSQACSLSDYSCADGRVADSRLRAFNSDNKAKKLLGMARPQIEAAIGTPGNRFSEWDASYWLKHQGFCMDGIYLVIDYDESDAAVDVRVVRD